MDTTQAFWWFIFNRDQLLLKKKNGTYAIPCAKKPPKRQSLLQQRHLTNVLCRTVESQGIRANNLLLVVALLLPHFP
ncbi:hypothetical protein EZS27_041207, partial [termite gut metagenome]